MEEDRTAEESDGQNELFGIAALSDNAGHTGKRATVNRYYLASFEERVRLEGNCRFDRALQRFDLFVRNRYGRSRNTDYVDYARRLQNW